MFAPDIWPAYFREARGCEVWDLDGKHYYDMSHNGVGACLLGYGHPEVTEAVTKRIADGSCCSLNPPEEVELADELCAIHPWAERVRFARGGGEACAVAVRIARATTGRSVIAVCGYHGWEDWYLAANLGESDALSGHLLPGLSPVGVPRALRDTTVTFPYEDQSALDTIIDTHGENLAAIIMEPCRYHDPDPTFLAHVRDV
ncbi:MAG TPA: aminotransferase class III-fold pyridoxal phosphate-dependent enzyme, partial [Candidatus Hydrogenedentes bacterium]|nr:aminotransferase class III-fold pyridoxal phosphate-dependent enzyme [Candidatus Hydrogenedentota bacterium]